MPAHPFACSFILLPIGLIDILIQIRGEIQDEEHSAQISKHQKLVANCDGRTDVLVGENDNKEIVLNGENLHVFNNRSNQNILS